jgi:hypothetical protein
VVDTDQQEVDNGQPAIETEYRMIVTVQRWQITANSW